ncbi:hypothetical protein PybrP1_006592 [[Pythium] brassicae (nom. inval.)]|nr:hypothetical protein PybrP1_006592 [[Pythium] brassicae (nom. inval.)]
MATGWAPVVRSPRGREEAKRAAEMYLADTRNAGAGAWNNLSHYRELNDVLKLSRKCDVRPRAASAGRQSVLTASGMTGIGITKKSCARCSRHSSTPGGRREWCSSRAHRMPKTGEGGGQRARLPSDHALELRLQNLYPRADEPAAAQDRKHCVGDAERVRSRANNTRDSESSACNHGSSTTGAGRRHATCAAPRLRKGVDSLSRKFSAEALRRAGLPRRFVSAVSSLHDGTTCRYIINGHESASVTATGGIRQGCPLALMLIIIALNVLYIWLARCGHIRGV